MLNLHSAWTWSSTLGWVVAGFSGCQAPVIAPCRLLSWLAERMPDSNGGILHLPRDQKSAWRQSDYTEMRK
jgi:hypothetical protein